MQGHKHVVKALATEYKAQVNVQSNQGTTPLYHACEGGRYSITKTLLEAGADTELGQKDSWKPIHGAVCFVFFLSSLFSLFSILSTKTGVQLSLETDGIAHCQGRQRQRAKQRAEIVRPVAHCHVDETTEFGSDRNACGQVKH